MKNFGIILLAIVCNSFAILSQDVHFSNMDYSPLTLNPALAGANEDLQAIVNYRTQWNSVGAPFQTIAASADMRLNTQKVDKKGHLAIGLNFFNDRAGVQEIITNNFNLNLAYHLMVQENQTIGLGMYTGFGSRSLDPLGGQWGNQYDESMGAFNPTISSGENFDNTNFSHVDVGAGMLYTYNSEESRMHANDGIRINAGYAVYHLNRPDYSFIGTGDPLFMRHALFSNASIGFNKTTMSIDPAFYLQFQGPATEILFGADYRVYLTDESKLTGRKKRVSLAAGAFIRNQDAFIARVLMDYGGLGIGFAYDFNISTLSEVTRGRGGAELFLRWRMENPLSPTHVRIK